MDKREVRFHLHWTDLKFLGKCNVHKRAIMADITPILWFLICHYHRPDHLGWVLFEVVADLPHVLLTIARRVRTLAAEKYHYAALDHLASPSKRFLKRHIITSQLWSHCWTTGTILMPPVLQEGSLRATELGDLRTSAWEDRRGDDCCGNDSSDWNLIFCHQEMRQIWWMVKV